MKAVNLIPVDRRRRRRPAIAVSPPTVAVIGGLALVLVGAVLYVTAANRVATRRSELTQVGAGVARWTAAAGSYAAFVQEAQQRAQELADVRRLAASRFPWSDLLQQIAGRMPRSAALISLQATTPSAAGAAASSQSAGSGIQLSGCAASQSSVAQTMVALRRVNGISGVMLSSSGTSGAGGTSAGGAATGATGSGGCPFPVQFQVSLSFGPAASSSSASIGAGRASGSASAGSTTASGSASAGSAPSAPGSSSSTAGGATAQ